MSGRAKGLTDYWRKEWPQRVEEARAEEAARRQREPAERMANAVALAQHVATELGSGYWSGMAARVRKAKREARNAARKARTEGVEAPPRNPGMSRPGPRGAHERGRCGTCGVDVAVRADGNAGGHGPYGDRCPGSYAPALPADDGGGAA